MRIFALIAASAFVLASVAAQAEPRSLSLAGVDQKLPGALGKAAEAPKVVEAPKPPDPAPPKAVEAAPATTTTPEKSKQAQTDKPRRKRAHWDEARIMREISRYSGYAGMIGGW